MKKYVFKQYSDCFPELFRIERDRIAARVKRALRIEHVGSTAVPGLGGKGIIDIAVAVRKEEMEPARVELEGMGYEFRPSGSAPGRFFFRIDMPDEQEVSRRYHVHLTDIESQEWVDFLAFRDYLRGRPEEAERYAELKKKAADEANEEGERYRARKEPLFEEILKKTRSRGRRG